MRPCRAVEIHSESRSGRPDCDAYYIVKESNLANLLFSKNAGENQQCKKTDDTSYAYDKSFVQANPSKCDCFKRQLTLFTIPYIMCNQSGSILFSIEFVEGLCVMSKTESGNDLPRDRSAFMVFIFAIYV